MKRFSNRLGLLLTALSLLTVAAAAYAGERPIHGRGSGHVDYNNSQLDASGPVRHLGRSSMLLDVAPGYFDSADLLLTFCRFTAANGDVLLAEILDQHFDPQTGVLTATILFFGAPDESRFVQAKGAANLTIVFEDWIGLHQFEGGEIFDFVLDGTIDY